MQFEVREEFFGCIVQDLENFRTYLFDKGSTSILKDLTKKPFKDVLDKYPKEATFFKNISLMKFIKDSKPNYYFIKNKPLKDVLSAPIRVHYAITSKCNLNCKHCFTRNILSQNKKELTFTEKLIILDNMQKMGIHEMLISGGEPFLAPDIIDFIKECKKRRVNIKVFSNGLLFNQELIEQIKDLPIAYLAISVDGANKESISKIRGNIDFNKLKNNLSQLAKVCKFPIVMQITVTKCNLNDIEEYIRLALETGVKRIKIRAIKPGGTILKYPEMMVSAKEYLDFCLRFVRSFSDKKINEQYGISMDATLGNTRLIYNLEKGKLMLENLPQPYVGFGCVGGRITLFIDSFGFCHPCAFIDNFLDTKEAENIKEKSLKKIWANNKNIIKMRCIRGNSKCKECSLYSLCRGGCRARSVFYNSTKDLNLCDGWCLKDLGLEIKNDITR